MSIGVDLVPSLLNRICGIIGKNIPEHKEHLYQVSIRLMAEGVNEEFCSRTTEQILVERIQKKIEKTGLTDGPFQFQLLFTRLQSIPVLNNRLAILRFLLAHSGNEEMTESQTYLDLRESLHKYSKSSGISSMGRTNSSTSGTNVSGNYTDDGSVEKLFTADHKASSVSLQSVKSTNTQPLTDSSSQFCQVRDKESDLITQTSQQKLIPGLSDVPERELIQELIFSFQGIEGKVLRLEPGGGFRIDAKAGISRSEKRIVLRLAEVGYLHNKVKEFCDNADQQYGIVYQSLVSAFRDELTDFYKLIAILQEQTCGRLSRLTLRRLLVWLAEPQARLQWLVTLATEAQFKKGGELISCLHGYIYHGGPPVQVLVQHLLSEVCRPLLASLSRWVLDGQIEDPCGEFFIEARPDVNGDRLWHEKYRLRNSMIPTFMTMEQAEKILATGKSIDFLREVCQESPPPPSASLKKLFDESNVETLYMESQGAAFHAGVENAYKETSRRVLDNLLNKYNLLHHLHAIKRYLLLGQGDFIRHLMEMLMPELSFPASQLTPHNLSAILESAIRSTNAQFEDADTLARLDVKVLQNSKQDTGWDVFSIIYHTNGPIGTIFESCEDQYMALFHALWNAKRMEFILSALWKNLTTSARTFRNIPGMQPVMQIMHLLTAEMIHLVHQMQYYVLFEVLECHWVELTRKLSTADSLDHVITAHEQFLSGVRAGALLDHSAEELGRQLRNIYSHIIQLQMFEERLCMQAQAELNAEKEREKLVESEQGFSTSTRDELLRKERQQRFQQVLSSGKGHLRTLAHSYQKHVRKFLAMLAEQPDVSLQLLSFRLDFNGHYKRISRQVNQRTAAVPEKQNK